MMVTDKLQVYSFYMFNSNEKKIKINQYDW